MAELKIGGTDYILNEGVTIIGRGLDADIIIDSAKISRLHVRVIVKGDEVEIEDLNSKNGTFVNGERIRQKKTVRPGDSIKIGNKECSLTLPGSSRETGARPKIGSDAKLKKRQLTDKDLGGRLLIAGAVLVLVIIGIVIFSASDTDIEPAPQHKQAEELITKVKGILKSAEPTDNVDENSRIIADLDHYAVQLGEIPASLKQETADAGTLQSRINDIIQRLENKNTEIKRQGTAMAEFDQISGQYADGSLPPADAMAAFEQIEKKYTGTKAADLAGEKVITIRTELTREEQLLITQARSEVLELAGNEQFKQALERADETLGKTFLMITDEDRAPLKKARADVIQNARAFFEKRAEDIAGDTQNGWEKKMDMLIAAYTKVDTIEGTKPVYKTVEQSILAEKNKQAEAAEQKVKKAIEDADALFKQRLYTQALKKYASAITLTLDEGEKQKLKKKKRLTELFAFGKKTVIDHITEKGGAALHSGGNIKSVNEEQFVVVGEEAGVVNMKWDELKYHDFVGLMDEAFSAKPDAKGYTLMGYICIENGKDRKSVV